MSKLQNAIVGGVRSAISYVPTSWLPGATPDPLIDKRSAPSNRGSMVPTRCGVRRALRPK